MNICCRESVFSKSIKFVLKCVLFGLGLNLIHVLMGSTSVSANICNIYLNPKIDFPFNDWPTAVKYRQFDEDIDDTLEKNSVASLISLYHAFRDGYHERYNLHLEELIRRYPVLNTDYVQLKKAMADFYKIEQKVLALVRKKILSFPSKKRMQFLRRQNLKKLKELDLLMDALMGLDTEKIAKQILNRLGDGTKINLDLQRQNYGNEEIWFDMDGEQQTSWSQLIELVELMDLAEGQLVSDLGSGLGRLGLLIGLLRPDVKFVGFELIDVRVDWANSAARSNGFRNVSFQTENLANDNLRLPQADHFYLFNPTSPSTSESLANVLLELSLKRSFKVYIRGGFLSLNFRNHFRQMFQPVSGFYVYNSY